MYTYAGGSVKASAQTNHNVEHKNIATLQLYSLVHNIYV